MNEIIEKENTKIENLIYEINGKQVMLDSDLANLYGTETKRINEAVRNNPEKFPERFSWILNKEEEKTIFEVENFDLKKNHGGRRYSIRVFTEQGVAMLATILKTKIAIQVSIDIMDAFVIMRKYISTNNYNNRLSNVETKLIDHDNKLNYIFNALESKKKTNEIYFNGQIYDAYSKIISIMKESKKELIIIDNYADISVLDMISKINKSVTLITKKNANLKQIDIDKYNQQYNNLTIIYNNTFHDRYIILDNQIIYHMGTSINHAGNKTFSINVLEDEIVINAIIDNIKTIILKSTINN